MLKKTLYALAAFLALSAPARAGDNPPPLTYVAIATFTAGGSATRAVAFQNTSTTDGLDIYITKIELSNAQSGSAITGGLMQFWVYGATVVVHGGTSQVQTHNPRVANATAPSYISFSTGPVGIVLEKVSTTKGALPLLRPLIINNDDAAAANFTDSWKASDEPSGAPITLLKGSRRAIVIEQQNLAATSVTAGVVMARIYYTVR